LLCSSPLFEFWLLGNTMLDSRELLKARTVSSSVHFINLQYCTG
jgi:hypothetical protein